MSGEADHGLRTVEPTAEGLHDSLSSFAANLPDKSNDLSASIIANRRLSPVKKVAITAFGAATALTGINSITSPDTADAIYCDVAERPNEAMAVANPNSGSDTTEAIDSTSETILFTFQSPNGETVSISLPDCKEVEKKDEIDKAIEEWTTKDKETGKYPVESMPYRFTDGESFSILNVFEPWRERYDFKDVTGMALQGTLLGYEVVNGYVFVHLGFEDWGPDHDSTSVLRGENTRFSMPFNMGKLDGNKTIQSWTASTDNFLEGVSSMKFYSSEELLETFLPKNKGKTVAGIFFPFKMNAKNTPSLRGEKFRSQIKTNNAAIPITREVVTSFFDLNNFNVKKRVELEDADFPQNVQRLINGRVDAENFSIKDYPFLLSIIDK